MVQEIFYSWFILIKRMKPDIKFIFSGDYAQLAPIKDRVKYCDYEDSQALYELVDGNIQKLTNCRRANKLFFSLTDPDNIKNLKKEHFYNQPQLRNLVFTNEKRKEINKDCMDKFIIHQAYNLARKAHKYKKDMTDKELEPYIKKQKAVEFKALPYDGNSQDVRLVEGTPIIAHKTVRNIKNKTQKEDDDELFEISEIQSVFNNEEFEIISIDSKNQVIKAKNTRTEIELPFHHFQQIFYVAFAITIHKSQGQTYNFNFSIWQWDDMDDRMKYVPQLLAIHSC
jgi:ATP-dependent exoDNAse (exonuclease V) alpha subunit